MKKRRTSNTPISMSAALQTWQQVLQMAAGVKSLLTQSGGWIVAITVFLLVCVTPAIIGVASAVETPKAPPQGLDQLPNTPLITQQGKTVRLYDDLIKGKTVVINFTYTHCKDICAEESARLAEVQKLLGERVGRDIFFYSLSIDPKRDTPAVVKRYVDTLHVGPGWLFLTGKPSDITHLEKELREYTQTGRDGAVNHPGTLIVCNGATGQWMLRPSTTNPQTLAALIGDWAKNRKDGEEARLPSNPEQGSGRSPGDTAKAQGQVEDQPQDASMRGMAAPVIDRGRITDGARPNAVQEAVPQAVSQEAVPPIASPGVVPPVASPPPSVLPDSGQIDMGPPARWRVAEDQQEGQSADPGPQGGQNSWSSAGAGGTSSEQWPKDGFALSGISQVQGLATRPFPLQLSQPAVSSPVRQPQPAALSGARSGGGQVPQSQGGGVSVAPAPPPAAPTSPSAPADPSPTAWVSHLLLRARKHRLRPGRSRGTLLLEEIGPDPLPHAQDHGARDRRAVTGGCNASDRSSGSLDPCRGFGPQDRRPDTPILSGLDSLALSTSAFASTLTNPSVIVDVGDSSSIRTTALLQHLNSLKTVSVPDPPDYAVYVRDRNALRLLGKALFWDQQLGSDGQACASCHFHAGADNRSLNQLDPGLRNTTPGVDNTRFSTELGFGPNYQLQMTDFPFHKLSNPDDRTSALISDTPNVTSSQGVFNLNFTALGIPGDTGVPNLTGPGAIFNVGGSVLVRNVAPRNTPSVLNSVLNHRNFWDGRARSEFNASNPIGLLDPTAQIVQVGEGGQANFVSVRIENSSSASQAVGPALSNMEMSFNGRQFPQLGRKMLSDSLVPLGQQFVAPDDSLLGLYSRYPERGIRFGYEKLVRKAFQRAWWDAPGQVVDVSGATPVIKQGGPGAHQFSIMEYNFPLYFGLAIREYEKLLISNDSPFDRFMEGDLSALSAEEQQGLVVFMGRGKCIACHGGPEFTNAGVTNFERLQVLERMIVGNFQTVQDLNEGYPRDPIGFHLAVYDNGFYNIGVRPTTEDLGVGDRIGPDNLPLSNSRRFLEQVQSRVKALQAADPNLDLESAVLQANEEFGVPRILARPGEAFNLLQRAALLLGNPGDVTTLLSRAYAILVVAGDDAALMEAVIDAALADTGCRGALGCSPLPLQLPSGVPANLTGASQLLVQARDLLASKVKGAAAANEVIQLMSMATMLLPDPFDPGPDPLRPLGPPLYPDELLNVDGALKVPSLRNVELTAPYFHNGGQATLEQVVAYYNRGGDFALENKDNIDPNVHPLLLTPVEREALVAFLKALTDDRVRYEKAPFDRPSLNVPNGGSGHITEMFGASVMDDRIEIPAVGAGGNGLGLGTPVATGTPLRNFLQP